jgi:hypothetical protein
MIENDFECFANKLGDDYIENDFMSPRPKRFGMLVRSQRSFLRGVREGLAHGNFTMGISLLTAPF